MALDPQLVEILACPEDKGPLLYFEDEQSLYNPRLKRRYAIRDDIPILLIDEAETVDDAENDRLLAKAEADGVREPEERGVEQARRAGGGRLAGVVGERMALGEGLRVLADDVEVHDLGHGMAARGREHEEDEGQRDGPGQEAEGAPGRTALRGRRGRGGHADARMIPRPAVP